MSNKEIIINANEISPQVTWGTSPQDVISINDTIPDPLLVSDDINGRLLKDLWIIWVFNQICQ